jgi:hypothetical protein
LYFYNHSIRVAETREEQLFDFNLADPCELVLRAVDVDTGEGIPGVAFVTENAGDEEWERPICHQTLGPNEIREMGVFEWEALDDASFQTDQQGYFRRYVGPRTSGWSYGIRVVPPGYEPVNRNGEVDWNEEVKIETPLGRKKAEHTFLLRRKKAAK